MALSDIIRISFVLVLNFLVTGCGFCPLSSHDDVSISGNSFVIEDVRVVDRGGVVEGATVVVRDGRVAAVGRVPTPAGLPVVDGSRRTLLPGLPGPNAAAGHESHFGPSATISPAEAVRLAGAGRIAPGTRADFVLVEGNPLHRRRNIARVFNNGFEVRGELHAARNH